MGCDIHAYTEVKTRYGWDLAGKPSSDRNYNFFGMIAGVRYDDNKIYDAKGFPEDSSTDVESLKERWDGDGHSHSYLTLKELKNIDQNKMMKISGMMDKTQLEKCKADFAKGNYDSEHLYPYCQGTNIQTHVPFELEMPISKNVGMLNEWIDHLEALPGTDEEKRIVFWFDN